MPNIGKSVTTNIRGILPLAVSLNTGAGGVKRSPQRQNIIFVYDSDDVPFDSTSLILYDAGLEKNIFMMLVWRKISNYQMVGWLFWV